VELIKIKISKGDFGKKFRLLDGSFSGAYNRGIDINRARKLAKNWSEVKEYGQVTLTRVQNTSRWMTQADMLKHLNVGTARALKRLVSKGHVKLKFSRPDGEAVIAFYQQQTTPYWGDSEHEVYYIVDGQHRIYAASELIEGDTHLYAIVRNSTSKPNKKSGFRVDKAVSALNSGTAFRLKDWLRTEQSHSPWPKAFKSGGRSPLYTEAQYTLTWPAIMRGVSVAHSSLKQGKIFAGGHRSKTILSCWRGENVDQEFLTQSVEAINWFYDQLDSRGSSLRRANGVLYGYKSVACVVLAYIQNSRRLSNGRPKSMVDAGQGMVLKEYSLRGMNEFVGPFMAGINYRKRRLLEVFGESGR